MTSVGRRALCACAALVLTGALLGGCGGVARRTSPLPPTSAADVLERDPTDRDDDRAGHSPDPDNDQTLTFGHPADAAEARSIASLIGRYYALAATSQATRACGLQYWLLRESLAERVEQSGRHITAQAACVEMAASLFARKHAEIVADAAAVNVAQVRVKQLRGVVLVRFGGVRERMIAVHREGTAWKMDTLLDDGSP